MDFIMENLNEIDSRLLEEVSNHENILDIKKGAYNIRKDGQAVERQITENINIVTKKDVSGIDIIIKENTKNEFVHIPAIKCTFH